jgi:hypothetical protein
MATQSSVYSIRERVYLRTLLLVRTQGTNVHNSERMYVEYNVQGAIVRYIVVLT